MLGIGFGVAAIDCRVVGDEWFPERVTQLHLGVASHIQITGINGELENWPALVLPQKQHPEVRESAPFIQSQAMFAVDGGVKGALVRGILPDHEIGSRISQTIKEWQPR